VFDIKVILKSLIVILGQVEIATAPPGISALFC
jgi:hypothetical protein